MTLRIDRSQLDPADAYELDLCVENSAKRRKRNQDAGLCINENRHGTHGLATDGVRCNRCALVHRLGARLAREAPEWR